MEFELFIITLGCFLASFTSAAFATGGVYIQLAASTWVLPITVAIPLQSPFALGSLLARIGLFWRDINWPIVVAFIIGAAIGVFFGIQVFVELDEGKIAILLGITLLVLIWFPQVDWRLPMKHPFALVGIIHSFLGTLFGVGALLQPSILRTKLLKAQITGTLAACLISMDFFKMTGYVSYGFRYQDYIPHIVLATLAGFVGTAAGKRVTHRISETAFRTVFRWLITLVALRMLYRGWTLVS